MDKEIFKDVIGYEGIYQVSNLGNVKSYLFKKPRNLLQDESRGYKSVTLCKNSIIKRFSTHLIVAESFLNIDINKRGYVIDHINANKFDNKVSNLQQITQRENLIKDNKNKNKLSGIWKNGNKYSSSIIIDGKKVYLGSFNTPEEANKEYLNKLNLIIKNK